MKGGDIDPSSIIYSVNYGNKIKIINSEFNNISVELNKPLFFLSKTSLE